MGRMTLGMLLVCALARGAAAETGPTVGKDSIRIGTQGESFSAGAYEKYGWKPKIEFRVNGPVASGSQLWVEVSYPGAKKKIQFDCPTNETEEGRSFKTECRANDKDLIDFAGMIDFSIHLRNELQGTKQTLFSGKAKVEKKVNPKPSPPEFWVNDDWTIPIGYVFFDKDNSHGDDVFLNVAFWIRGNPPEVEAHLFYKGKDLAKYTAAGNSGPDWKPDKPLWGLVDCAFLGVYPKKPEDDGAYDPKFDVSANPGEYEVKVLLAGHLARSIKFKVGPDGKLDKSLAAANKLGSDKAIVPVQVIGNRESAWDRSAWKTGAFYGNPLTGFAALPPK
jgi:hypothetical protein